MGGGTKNFGFFLKGGGFLGASQRRGDFIFELFFITEILCFLLPVVMGFGVFSNFRSWGMGQEILDASRRGGGEKFQTHL